MLPMGEGIFMIAAMSHKPSPHPDDEMVIIRQPVTSLSKFLKKISDTNLGNIILATTIKRKEDDMKKAYQLEQAEDSCNQLFHHDVKESVRINKYLASSGFCSRRKADILVQEGKVTIDGILAEMGSQVVLGQQVLVAGTEITAQQSHVYIALHKPVGIVCTVEREQVGNIADFMNYDKRIFPIGRLDKDSTGLILLTSDGDIVNKILRAENNNEKEYIVQVNHVITPDFLQRMSRGVEITNMRTKTRQRTKACRVEQLSPHTFRLVLTQGLNRQIRRMCAELGYRVVALRRVRIMNIHLGSLQLSQWRYLTQQELSTLNEST